MKRVAPIIWISLGLVGLTVSMMLAGDWLVDLVPSRDREISEYRRDFAESLAVQYSTLAGRDQIETVKFAMAEVVKRNPDILSLALRHASGTVVAQVGDHAGAWARPPNDESTLDSLQVPIFSGDQRWGVFQVAFRPTALSETEQFFTDPWVRFLVFVSVVGFVGYFFFLARALGQLDPSGGLPDRVKTTLDSLTQGVVVVDAQDRIVLANSAFCRTVGQPAASLVGSDLSALSWMSADATAGLLVRPWTEAIEIKRPQEGACILLGLHDNEPHKFIVNAVPIIDDGSTVKGALVSFQDITDLDRVSSQLSKAKSEIELSRVQILEKDRELDEANQRLQEEMNKRQKTEQMSRQVGMKKGEEAA